MVKCITNYLQPKKMFGSWPLLHKTVNVVLEGDVIMLKQRNTKFCNFCRPVKFSGHVIMVCQKDPYVNSSGYRSVGKYHLNGLNLDQTYEQVSLCKSGGFMWNRVLLHEYIKMYSYSKLEIGCMRHVYTQFTQFKRNWKRKSLVPY